MFFKRNRAERPNLPPEPSNKRTVVFIDGQNLFYAAKHAFGYKFPNYDPLALGRTVCTGQGWRLEKIHFYSGLPRVDDNPRWNYFWTQKLAHKGKRGIKTFSRHLKYRNQTVRLTASR